MSKYRFKVIGVLALAVVLTFTMTACDLLGDDDPQPREPTYNLTVNYEGLGETTPQPGTHAFEQNTMVNLEAIPYDEDWEFAYWEGPVSDRHEASTQVFMDRDKEVNAVFVESDEASYDLTVNYDGRGTTQPEMGTHTYEANELVEIVAHPAEGWEFDYWRGDVMEEDENEAYVYMDGDRQVTAVFAPEDDEPDQYQLIMDQDGQGTVTPSLGVHNYDEYELVELAATPAEGWQFERWEGEVVDPYSPETTLLMEEDREVKAVFVEEETPDPEIEEVEDPEPITVDYGTEWFEAEDELPDTVEVRFDDGTAREADVSWEEPWDYDSEPTEDESYEIDGSADVQHEDEFFTVDAEVELTVLGEGDIEPDVEIEEVAEPEGIEVEYGTSHDEAMDYLAEEVEVTFTDGHSENFEIAWDHNINYDGETPGNYTFGGSALVYYENVDVVMDLEQDVTVSEQLVEEYSLTVYTDGEGEVNIIPDQNLYEEGTEVTLEADSAEGWKFYEWDGEVADPGSFETTITMDDDKTITAHFEEDDEPSEPVEEWIFDGHDTSVTDVAVDEDGYVYSGSSGITDNTVKKIDPDGDKVWTFDGHNDYVYGVAVDEDGYIYSGSRDGTLRKIDLDGDEVWTFEEYTGTVRAVTVDEESYVYSGNQDNTVRKIDPDGDEVWSFDGHDETVRTVAVNEDGYVYSGSYYESTVKKIDPDGDEVWTFDGHDDDVYAVAVDEDGYVYSGSGDDTIKKIDPNGNEIWTFDGHTNNVRAVTVDEEGYVYSGSTDDTVRKIDPGGDEVWSFDGHFRAVVGVAVDEDGYVYSVSVDGTVRKIRQE